MRRLARDAGCPWPATITLTSMYDLLGQGSSNNDRNNSQQEGSPASSEPLTSKYDLLGQGRGLDNVTKEKGPGEQAGEANW